jgi:adenosine/AMP kinase
MKPYKGIVKIYCDLHKCIFGKDKMDPACADCEKGKAVIVGLDDQKLQEVARDKDRAERKEVR